MRRTFVTLCALPLLLSGAACKRSSTKPSTDRYLDSGYALLIQAPERALAEFERSTDTGERKQYALGQAHEALGHLGRAQEHYDRALAARPGFVKAETARARLALLQGDRTQARERLSRVVGRAPEELPALLLYGLVVESPADVTRAVAALKAWPERAKAKEPPAEYLLVLALLERPSAGRAELAEAAERVRRAPIHAPSAALALAELAVLCGRPWLAQALVARLTQDKQNSADATKIAALALRLGQIELAAKAALSIQVYPEVRQSQLVLGEVALATGDAAQALGPLRRAVALLPPGPSQERDQAEFLLAQALLRQKDLAATTPLLTELARRDPKNLAVQLLSAELELELGQAPAAALRLERLRSEQPKQPSVFEHLSRARRAAGDADGAIEALRAGAALTPEDPKALERLVLLQLELGRKDAALSELEQQAQARPDDEAVCLLLARTAESAGRPRVLRAALLRFTERQPGSVNAWLSLARLEEREHHPEAVQRALTHALGANPRSTPALLHLAEWSMRQEKWQAAAETYERLLAITPDDPSALNNLGYLYADRLDRTERAVEVAERAHRLAPERPLIDDTLGWALLRRGRAEDRPRALALLRHASELVSQDDVRLHFAVALHLTGEQDRARELLRGFRFRPADPGHAFARSILAQTG